MSDDIVDRLRDGANWTGPLKLEAADEIERLQAELTEWKQLATEWKQLAQERDPHSWANLASKKHGLESVRPVQSELRRRWT